MTANATVLPSSACQKVALARWIHMHCELLGATEAEQVHVLVDLLTGLSGRPGAPIHQRELTIKSQVSPFTELKLVQQISEGKVDDPEQYVASLLALLA